MKISHPFLKDDEVARGRCNILPETERKNNRKN